jgi:raffinose/stachyose/melibiose transport system substrate-binding protein
MLKKRFFILYRYILLFMAFILFAATLSSCYDSEQQMIYYNDSRYEADRKIKLRFINTWGGVDPQSDLLNGFFKEFMEKHPKIEVVNESVFGEDFLPKLKTDFASGNDPDVFGLYPGSDIRALIKADKVADLTDLLDEDPEWKSSFKSNAWSYTTIDGRIYGLPYEVIFEGLFINKDLFKWYDVKIPETYEELKQAVKAFKAHGITPIAYNSLAEGTFLYQNIVAALSDGEAVRNPVKDGQVSDCYIKGMYIMKELFDLGAFPDPEKSFKMDNKERDTLFLNKHAAMIAQGSWFIGRIENAYRSNIDIIPFPSMDGSNPKKRPLIYGFGGGTFYMSKSAWDNKEKREAAILLLKELTSKELAPEFTKAGMLSNIINTDISSYNNNPLRIKGLSLINNASELIGPPDSFVNRTGWEEIIVQQFPFVLAGKKTPESVWDEYARLYGDKN